MKHTPLPVWISFERYQVLSSNKNILFIGRIVELGSFSFTERIIPSFHVYVSIIRRNGQNDRGVFSVSKYPRKNLSRKMFIRAWTDFHIVRLCKFLTSGLSNEELKFALPIRKWFCVTTWKSFISFETGMSGLLFKVNSTSVRKVTNDSS